MSVALVNRLMVWVLSLVVVDGGRGVFAGVHIDDGVGVERGAYQGVWQCGDVPGPDVVYGCCGDGV